MRGDSLLSLALVVAVLSAAFIPTVHSTSVLRQAFSPSITGFKTTIFYYGWLNTSNILELRVDIAVVAGSTRIFAGGGDYDIVQWLRGNGTEVYAYLHNGDTPVGMGSSFNVTVYTNNTGTLQQRVSYWKSYIESLIDNYVGVVDGIFLDECDPGYFGVIDPANQYLQAFSQALADIVAYAHSRGLKVFVNGVRAYASLGDYYLWEEFVAVYNTTTGEYVLDTSFYNTNSTNPYEWVNGIAKYNYLKANDLLGKTIALSLANHTTLDNALYGYYMARILGLAGWAFSPWNIYASGGTIYTVKAIDPGPPISGPVFNTVQGRATRYFTAGEVSVDLYAPSIKIPFKPLDIDVDGEPNEYTLNTTGIAGSSTTINAYGYLATPSSLHVYVNATWSTPSTGGLIHLYIDYDNNTSTGYSIYGVGADYLVEIQASGYAYYAEYTGSGSDWSWNELGQLTKYKSFNGNTGIIEFKVPSTVFQVNRTVFILTTMVSWSDDASARGNKITDLYIPYLTIYDKISNYVGYIGLVTNITYTSNSVIIDANGPSGAYVNYTILIKARTVIEVLKNGTPLPQRTTPSFPGEGYYAKSLGRYVLLVVVAKHSSPIELVIEYSIPQPINEPWYIVIILATLMLVFTAYTFRRK